MRKLSRRLSPRSGAQSPVDALGQDRNLFRGDRTVRLRRLPAASELARAGGVARRKDSSQISAASALEPAERAAAQPARSITAEQSVEDFGARAAENERR